MPTPSLFLQRLVDQCHASLCRVFYCLTRVLHDIARRISPGRLQILLLRHWDAAPVGATPRTHLMSNGSLSSSMSFFTSGAPSRLLQRSNFVCTLDLRSPCLIRLCSKSSGLGKQEAFRKRRILSPSSP